MSAERITSVVGVDPKTRRVIFRTESGSLVEQAVPRLEKPRKRLSEKAGAAIDTVKPLAKEVLIKRGQYREEQSAYFEGLEQLPTPYPSDDPKEKYRLACVDLTFEGVSSRLAAETILNENPDILASLALGSLGQVDFDKAVRDFAREIVRYYPRNFWASDAKPRK